MLFTRHRELTRDTAETIRGRLATSLRGTDLGLSERCDPLLILASTTASSKVALDIVASQITKHVVVENERAQINGSLGETPANIASPHRPPPENIMVLTKASFSRCRVILLGNCETISFCFEPFSLRQTKPTTLISKKSLDNQKQQTQWSTCAQSVRAHLANFN